MSEAPRLYQLQLVDLELDDKRRQIKEAEEHLGDTVALRAVRERHDATRARVRRLEERTRELEGELDAKDAKIKDLQQRLFGGGIKRQQEAAAVDKELQALREAKERIESGLLEAMAEAEELPAALTRQEEELRDAEAAWAEQQEGLRAKIGHLSAEATALEQTRQRAADGITSAALQTYEELRRTRRGRGVARVERNTCLGCRVALPMGEVQNARKNPQLSFCNFCGRIIYVER